MQAEIALIQLFVYFVCFVVNDCMILAGAQRVGAQGANFFGKLGAVLRKLRSLGRRQVEHAHAFAAQPDLIEQLLRALYPATGVEITFQVMTFAFQSAGHHDTVGPMFKGVQYEDQVQQR